MVKNEFVRFETERVEDFKNSLEAFLEGMVKRQKIVRPSLTRARRWLTEGLIFMSG